MHNTWYWYPQVPVAEAAKWNLAIIIFIIYSCAFPTVTKSCQKTIQCYSYCLHLTAILFLVMVNFEVTELYFV